MEYQFNYLLLVPQKLEQQFIIQQLQQMIGGIREDEIDQLVQGVPFSESIQLGRDTGKITYEYLALNENTFQIQQLQQLAPSVIMLVIPMEDSLQAKIASMIKSNIKILRQLKSLPIVALLTEKGFAISNSLMKQLTNAHITTELNSNVVENIGAQLIRQRIQYRACFLQHVGEDYALDEEKGICASQ